jgi:hypothetical protein
MLSWKDSGFETYETVREPCETECTTHQWAFPQGTFINLYIFLYILCEYVFMSAHFFLDNNSILTMYNSFYHIYDIYMEYIWTYMRCIYEIYIWFEQMITSHVYLHIYKLYICVITVIWYIFYMPSHNKKIGKNEIE